MTATPVSEVSFSYHPQRHHQPAIGQDLIDGSGMTGVILALAIFPGLLFLFWGLNSLEWTWKFRHLPREERKGRIREEKLKLKEEERKKAEEERARSNSDLADIAFGGCALVALGVVAAIIIGIGYLLRIGWNLGH